MKAKRWSILIFLSIALGACGTVADNHQMNSTDVSQTESVEENTVKVSVEIDPGNQQEKISHEIEVAEDSYLLDVLKEHYTIEEKDGFIEAIEGFKQNPNDNIYWTYTVNGEFAEVGAAEYQLADGDQVIWTLTQYD